MIEKLSNDRSRLKDYFEWVNANDSEVSYSDVWEECKNTFTSGKNSNSLRGYANNRDKNFRRLSAWVRWSNSLFNELHKFVNYLNRGINAFFSLVASGDRATYRKYGLHYDVNIEQLFSEIQPGYYLRYQEMLSSVNEYYSYSSLRTFYYYSLSEKYLPKNKSPVFLEVGAGMANFAAHILRRYENINYYIVDIPEIIPAAMHELSNTEGLGDVEFYLPQEFEKFNLSKSNKKVIWLLPCQLNGISGIGFDFISNTESFAEMLPYVSQGYISLIDKVLVEGGHFLSVNRAVRMVGKDYADLSNLTSPFRYDMAKCKKVYFSIDEFRALVPKFHQEPNLVSVWKK